MREYLNPLAAASLAGNVILIVVLAVVLAGRESREAEPAAVATTQEVIAREDSGDTPTPTATTAALTAPTDTPMPTETPQPTDTPVPTPTSTSPPTPTNTPPPVPTETPFPTSTPTPTATPLPSGPDWLQYLNRFRQEAGLPLVDENPSWSEGARLHSIYMSGTGNIWHSEDPNSRFFTAAGNQAAANGNLAANFITTTGFEWAFNYWLSAPFHALPMLDPGLTAVGFGQHRDAAGAIEVAATLDIKSGLQDSAAAAADYPILFPKDGGQTWVLQYSLPEFPDARESCGFPSRVGPPIMVQLGPGNVVPNVTSTKVEVNGRAVAHCVFDETDYFSSRESMQATGRFILDQRDGVVILPESPFQPDSQVTVTLVVNGQTINWSFTTVARPSP